MRRIRIFEHISLDGVIAPRGNDEYAHGGWTAPYRSPDGRDAVIAAQGSGFDLLLGRRTYDLWSGYWPKAGSNPIADNFNAGRKYVVTHRPENLAWGPAEGLGGDIATALRHLKAADAPDLIVWGSSTVTSVLFEEGLVDEVTLFVYPVLLGGGLRFFPEEASPRELALVSTKTTARGVHVNVYRHVGPLRATR
jgi:dihydrofolate reductase